MTLAIAIYHDHTTIHTGFVPPFAIDRAAADAYAQMAAIAAAHGARLAEQSWTPEAQAQADKSGLPGPEWILIHPDGYSEALFASLREAGLGADVLVQKHGPWEDDEEYLLNAALLDEDAR